MKIDLSNVDEDNINEFDIYDILKINGNEEAALNDEYYELFRQLGKENMLKLFKYYHGEKIKCPKNLYNADYIAKLAGTVKDRRDRAVIARLGGYTFKYIENVLKTRKNNEDGEK